VSSTIPALSREIRTVLYTAAHGGFAGQAVPLGGGAAVANLLTAEWTRSAPFELKLIGPAILGPSAPTARDIVSFSERQYAAFCDAFRKASTEEVLRHDPAHTAVLVNDISEGPDFERIAQAGFRVVTIYHVDVVAYIASIYLRGWIRPESLTRWWERLRGSVLGHISPAILRLIFEQQRASLLWSERVVVPSAGMREIMLRCYPDTPPGRIEVLPWGCPSLPPSTADSSQAPPFPGGRDMGVDALRAEYGIERGAYVLLCLSRISPEKGHDFVLQTLLEWERSPSFPSVPVWLFICGEPAFMNGRRYASRLRTLAARLQRVHVVFAGYVTGARKSAFLALADVYLFPSSHESYGLTLTEALSAGLPAISRDHAGARQILAPEFGLIVPGAGRPARLLFRQALEQLLRDNLLRASMARCAAQWANARPFSASAKRLAGLLMGSSAPE
jgi:glycosyltransferase involved in cell wall biosynthesis